jgi:hypothetical protein
LAAPRPIPVGARRLAGRLVRPRLDEVLVGQVIRSLTDRDRMLCEHLYEHRVLTSDQIRQLGYASLSRTQTRLVALHRRRVLDRFRPYVPTGSAPYHYLLDQAGAAAVAAARGVELDQLGWRRDHALRYATSQRLGHLVGVNGVFTSLIGNARRNPGYRLTEWWSETRCAAAFGALARPDGYGRWQHPAGTFDFWLEYDTGTETLGRVAAKLDGYQKLATVLDRPVWLLAWTSTLRREAALRRAIAGRLPLVATTCGQLGTDAAAPVWLPAPGHLRLAPAALPQATR